MKAVLSLELIGDNLVAFERAWRRGQLRHPLSLREEIDLHRRNAPHLRPHVARILGRDGGDDFRKEFLADAQRDYSDANGIGSRGIRAYYILDSGVYEVNERLTWANARRYYIRVEGPTITEISRQEVYRWLNDVP